MKVAESKQKIQHQLHVDASFNFALKKAGYAYSFKRGKGTKVYQHEGVCYAEGSQWAEIQGMIYALKHAYQSRAIRTGDHIDVYCDCQDVGRFMDEKHSQYKQDMLYQEYSSFISKKKLTVSYHYVKAHQSVSGKHAGNVHAVHNNNCDLRAKNVLINSFTAHDKILVAQHNAQEKERELRNAIKNEIAKLNLGDITVSAIAFDKKVASHKNNLLLLADYFTDYKGLALRKHQIHRWLKVIIYASKVKITDIFAFQNVDALEMSLRLMGVFLPENSSSYVQTHPMGKKAKVIIA